MAAKPTRAEERRLVAEASGLCAAAVLEGEVNALRLSKLVDGSMVLTHDATAEQRRIIFEKMASLRDVVHLFEEGAP